MFRCNYFAISKNLCSFVYQRTMQYSNPTIFTPIDPILHNWTTSIPERFRQNAGLMAFLLRICHRIYDGNGIERGSNINPFYKIVELLEKSRLEYIHLQTIKEYYHFDIIRYLTNGNIGENYIGYPCNSAKQLRSALGNRKNITDRDTLANILSNIV